jgi:hypothetical protein
MRPILAAILLLIAGPAMAQSTLILPEPGGGYLVVPRLRGRRRRSFRSPANSSRTRAIRHECRGS